MIKLQLNLIKCYTISQNWIKLANVVKNLICNGSLIFCGVLFAYPWGQCRGPFPSGSERGVLGANRVNPGGFGRAGIAACHSPKWEDGPRQISLACRIPLPHRWLCLPTLHLIFMRLTRGCQSWNTHAGARVHAPACAHVSLRERESDYSRA